MYKIENYWLFLFVSILSVIFVPTFAKSAPLVFIQPVSSLVGVGSSQAVEIRVSDIVNLYGVDINLNFDPNVLQGISSTTGEAPIPDYVVLNNIDNNLGKFVYAVTQLAPSSAQTGDFLIAQVEFEATALGTSGLELSQVILSDPDGLQISVTLQNGEIEVGNLPDPFNKLSPSNDSNGQPINVAIDWEDSYGATYYEYCFDTVDNDACDTSWVNVGDSMDTIGPLEPATAYYWQTRAHNPVGNTEANGGTWWSFNTGSLSAPFGKYMPLHGSSEQSLSTLLSWGASIDASGYEYCIDTSDDNACSNPWINVGLATYASLTGLSPSTSYFWQTRALNAVGTSEANGDVWWTFSTGIVGGAENKVGLKEAIYALQVVSGMAPPPPVIDDPDLQEGNIKTGVEILGVIGSLRIAWGCRYNQSGSGTWNGSNCYDDCSSASVTHENCTWFCNSMSNNLLNIPGSEGMFCNGDGN